MLSFFVGFFGCGDEFTNEEEKALKDLVKDEVVEGKPKKITWEKDGKEMVLIPAGSFEMGDHFSEGNDEDELPVHTVTLDAFYMDTHEVTVGQFKQFVNHSGYDYPDRRWNDVAHYSPGDDYPMMYVSWNDAVAYTEWVGKRLPTEAEWEYAARGGLEGQRYPWGNELTHNDANYTGTGGKDSWDKCSPVGSFEANGYGLYDMAGNVWEWCQDWYGKDYYTNSPVNNPQGPETGRYQVLRGGSWAFNSGDLRLAYRHRDYPYGRYNNVGFRCVSGSN